jgi:DNA-binding transcriptional LysR family regulator
MAGGMRSLDPDAVHAFVLIAELRSFTRAAQVLNSTQAAVSLKLRRLEDRLGQRLVERTPRLVRPSAAGLAFLDAARDFVAAHRRAMEAFDEVEPGRLAVGLSHHIVGTELPLLLGRLGAADRSVVVDLRVGPTRELLDRYDAGQLDAVILLRHDESRRGGEVLLREDFGWFSTPGFEHRVGTPLPLATQAEPCHLRAMAVERLEAAGIAWRAAFVSSGVATVGAAAAAGLAVAALARRVAPLGAVDVGERLGLPRLPSRDVVLHSNLTDARSSAALRGLVGALRATCVADHPARG